MELIPTPQNKKEIKVTFGDINKNNIDHLRQLNNLNLPVRYQNGFYARLVAKLRYGKFAYFNDIIVGAITWKYDNFENQRSIYIMTINVFDDYKRHNIGKININSNLFVFKNILHCFVRLTITSRINKHSQKIRTNQIYKSSCPD
jgi:hypothetical protein